MVKTVVFASTETVCASSLNPILLVLITYLPLDGLAITTMPSSLATKD